MIFLECKNKNQIWIKMCIDIPWKLVPCKLLLFFYTNHGSLILIFFGKAPSPTALVEFIAIDKEHEEGEELVKDFASFHIRNESPSPEM